MENLDLIILTTVVVVVFGIFSISLLRGFGSKDGIKQAENKN
jgi:hypothetical protein